ncbi:MAG: TIR domain-containing protein [Promethearchaeota archaeon]
MSPTKTYNIYISLAWTNSDNYNRLVEILNNIRYFHWKNYSAREHDSSEEEITADFSNVLFNQIRHADFIIIFAGMYNTHRKWMEKEIEIANGFDIPILGIKPWEKGQDVPSEVVDATRAILSWKSHSIANYIQRYMK